MPSRPPGFGDLYTVLCQDIYDFSPRVGRSLPDSFTGAFVQPDASFGAKEVAALALARCIGKKNTDTVSPDAGDRCLLSFLESNDSCRDWKPLVAPVNPLIIVDGYQKPNPNYQGARAVADRELLELMKACLNNTFMRPTPKSLLRTFPDFDGSDPWSWENVFLCGDIGPGSAQHASGTSWYDKFYQSPLSYSTPLLWSEYKRQIPAGSLRAIAEDQRESQYGHVQVQGGKYSSVPKDWKTDRSIDIQPSLNMWAQKGIACIMGAFVFSNYGVNLMSQPLINKELARRGSILDTIATIDESEASNRIPWSFVEWALEGTELLELLRIARCTHVLMPWHEWIPLHMCSGMGNGFTFILMTAINLAAVEAVHIYREREFRKNSLSPADESWLRNVTYFNGEHERFVGTPGEVLRHLAVETGLHEWAATTLKQSALQPWGVFGDDIIVLSDLYEDVVRLLGCFNARVNLDKSFPKGNFRESCGGDFWLGTDVRAVYAKSLATPQDRVSLLNRLLVWSARHDIPLVRTCKLLWRSCRNDVTFVPLHEDDHAGLRVPGAYARPTPLSRAFKDIEVAIQRPIRSYCAWRPVVRKKTLRGAQLSIYGVGILLSMIRNEIASPFKHADVTASQPASKTEKEPPNLRPYSLSERQDNTALVYEAQWLWSADWDRTDSTLPTARQMDRAIALNLGFSIA